MIEILIAWKEIACQGVVSGLCCPGPRSTIYFFPDDRRFRSSFLRVFHGEHMRESLFHKHSRAARQITPASIHVTRPDPRPLNRVTSYLSTRYFISRATNRKDPIREMRMLWGTFQLPYVAKHDSRRNFLRMTYSHLNARYLTVFTAN